VGQFGEDDPFRAERASPAPLSRRRPLPEERAKNGTIGRPFLLSFQERRCPKGGGEAAFAREILTFSN